MCSLLELFGTNMIEKYDNCPDYNYNNMSLLEFAILCDIYYAKEQDASDECIDQYQTEWLKKKSLHLLTTANY